MNVPILTSRKIIASGGLLEIDGNVNINGRLNVGTKKLEDFLSDAAEEAAAAAVLYTWIKYSPNSDGSYLTDSVNPDTRYIGMAYNKKSPVESLIPSDYTWSLFKAADGQDNINLLISNENVTVSADFDGTVSPTDYNNTRSSISVIQGNTLLKYNDLQLPYLHNELQNSVDYTLNITEASLNNVLEKGQWVLFKASFENILPISENLVTVNESFEYVTTNSPTQMSEDSAKITYFIIAKNTLGEIVNLSKSQTLSKAKIGPGVLFRGTYDPTKQYFHSAKRRDAVYYNPTGTWVNSYWLTADTTLNGQTWPSPDLKENDPSNPWTEFGAQFSSIATGVIISEESYVKNTLNVGTNEAGDGGNITLWGGDTKPWMSIGQVGTAMQFGATGIWMGIDSDSIAKLSLGDNTNSLKWDGQTLQISGEINITGGNAATKDYADLTGASAAAAALETFSTEVIGPIQAQIDGEISTWFYNGQPTLLNEPALNWNTEALLNAHRGDLYYDNLTGYAYRFQFGNDQYFWSQISDTAITKALADAAAAKDTADGKRRVFIDTPYTPYDPGDLWTGGSGGDLKRCWRGRVPVGVTAPPNYQNGTFQSSDWELATKYTDDSAINTFLGPTGQYATDLQLVSTQIDKKAETFYQTTAPWPTVTNIAPGATSPNNFNDLTSHVSDLWYDSTSTIRKTYIYQKFNTGTSVKWTSGNADFKWMQMDVPKEIFDLADGKKRVFISQPIPPYDLGDLWSQGATGDLMVCNVAKGSTGTYSPSDWQKGSKYTDDTTANAALEFGSGKNLFPQAEFANGLDDWMYGYSLSSLNAAGRGVNLNSDWSLNGNTDMRNNQGLNTAFMVHGAWADEQGEYAYISSKSIKGIQGGKKYIASAYVGNHRADRVDIYVEFFNSNGSRLNFSDSNQPTCYCALNEAAGGQNINGYKRIYAVVTAHQDAVSANIVIRKFGTAEGYSDSYMFVCRPMLEQVLDKTTKPGPWSPYASSADIIANKEETALLANNMINPNTYKGNTTVRCISGGGYTPQKTRSGFNYTGIQANLTTLRLYDVIKSNGWWTVSFDLYSKYGDTNKPNSGIHDGLATFKIDICDSGEKTFTIHSGTSLTNPYHVTHSVYVGYYSTGTYNFVDISSIPWIYFNVKNLKIENADRETKYVPSESDYVDELFNTVGNKNLIPLSNLNLLISNSTQYEIVGSDRTNIFLDSGKTYTISFNGSNISSHGYYLKYYIYNLTNAMYTEWNLSYSTSINSTNDTTSSTTFTVPHGYDKFRIACYIYNDNPTLNNVSAPERATSGTFKLNWVKLEEGNFATAWSESPNDTANRIATDSTGKLNKSPYLKPGVEGKGLYLGQEYLGYYDGAEWKTYMSNEGKFFLTGANGSANSLSWDGTNLDIVGKINATVGSIGGWNIGINSLISKNDNILLNSDENYIKIFDTDGNMRFSANTETVLPSALGQSFNKYLTGSLYDISQNASDLESNTTYDFTISPGNILPDIGTSNNFTVDDDGTYQIVYEIPQNSQCYVRAYGLAWSTATIKMELYESSNPTNPIKSDSKFRQVTGGATFYGGGIIPALTASVIKGTLIRLSENEFIEVEKIKKYDYIYSFDWINSKSFIKSKVLDIKSRAVDYVYEVKTETSTVKVSDSHKFWLDDDKEISVKDLIANNSQIYVYRDNVMIKELVLEVNLIHENTEVYTLSIDSTHNYISNNIISHNKNPVEGDSYWVFKTNINTFEDRKFLISCNLKKNIEYFIKFKVIYTLESEDTSALYVNGNSTSSAEVSVYVGTGTLINFLPSVTGLIVNGGGVRAMSDKDNYLEIAKGGSGATAYSATLKGRLLADEAIGFSSVMPGYLSAAKAFCKFDYVNNSTKISHNIYSITKNADAEKSLDIVLNGNYGTNLLAIGSLGYGANFLRIDNPTIVSGRTTFRLYAHQYNATYTWNTNPGNVVNFVVFGK